MPVMRPDTGLTVGGSGFEHAGSDGSIASAAARRSGRAGLMRSL
jgi:hypothetical protein